MIIVLAVIVVGLVLALWQPGSRGPGALCTRCGGLGYVQTTGYAGRTEHCFSPNGRHF